MEEKQKTTSSEAKTKKIIGILSIILSIVIAFAGGFFTRHFITPSTANLTSEMIAIMEQYAYVIDGEGNLKSLNESEYANALISGLNDDYARYYTKEEYQKKKEEQEGFYNGFGITLYVKDGYNFVFDVLGNSPAEKAGLMPNDKLISATSNGQTVQLNSIDIGEYLTGFSNGEEVEFLIERKGQTQSINVIKSSYKMSYVKYFDSQGQILFDFESGTTSRIEENKIDVDNHTALVKIEAFEGEVAYQLGKALEQMQKQERTKLILDLRNNGGGDLQDLIAVSRHLIYNGGNKTLIACSEGKNESQSYYMYGPIRRDNITDVVVLANENTASASECLIGAMLYYGEKNFSKDRLILEKNSDGASKTFGKGIMQKTFLLSNGGAFKLTAARMLWPDKETCIHGKGITTTTENSVNAGGDAILRARELLSEN